jgi:hypothetical protein
MQFDRRKFGDFPAVATEFAPANLLSRRQSATSFVDAIERGRYRIQREHVELGALINAKNTKLIHETAVKISGYLE